MDNGRWYRCKLRDKFCSLPRGQVVAVCRSKLVHLALGQTYWLMSIENDKLYQVAGDLFGRNLNQLIIVERPVKDEALCKENAKRLLERGQYGPEHRHEIKTLLKRSAGKAIRQS